MFFFMKIMVCDLFLPRSLTLSLLDVYKLETFQLDCYVHSSVGKSKVWRIQGNVNQL